MRAFLLTTIAITGVSFVMSAQQPRDVAATRTPGTAAISGTIVTDGTESRPLRQVTVTVRASDANQTVQQATTGDDGRFVLSGLSAGRFTLVAAKPAYVSQTYGAKSPTSSGVPISLAEGQQLNVTMRLIRGAVVTGRLTGPGGLPAVGARVTVGRFQMMNGERRLVAVGSPFGGLADDRGVFRLFGLPPGEYVVQGSFGLGISANNESRIVTAAEYEWAARQVGQTSAISAGATNSATSAPPRGPGMGTSPIFYPGTTDSNAATLIKLAAGEERTGLDFTMDYVPTAKIEGVILDPEGKPPVAVQANLLQTSQSFSFAAPIFLRPDTDGKFSANGVLPGQWSLVVRGASELPAARPAATGSSTLPLWALVDIPVNGRDITDLVVKLAPGMNVSGRIVFEGTSPPPNLTSLRVNLSSMGVATGVTVGAGQVTPDADGTFRITGVTPSRYRLAAAIPVVGRGSAAAPTWTLKSAVVNGRDSQDYPLEVVGGQDVADAVITFTDQPSQLSGSLTDAGGQPAPDYFMIVFSTDKAFWSAGSRRVKQVRPASNGIYTVTGLPAGEYYMSALTDLEPNQITDLSFLESITGASLKITLADGEKKTQDLRIAGR